MTPRRILLLVGGMVACGVAYVLYARLFGSVDGLPQLPARMLAVGEGKLRPPERPTSPTIELLKLGFGDNAPETESAHYPTQLEFRQANSSIVIAAGSTPSKPDSERIPLSPFSAAVIRKERPAHLRQPGEAREISTIHADKAVLVFDRKIKTTADMFGGDAKLVRVEFVSEPEHTIDDPLHRRGRVHITNNQKSADPNKKLVLKTVGPVFYHDHKAEPDSPASLGPDLWTDAPVEIVDLGNIPQRSASGEKTAQATGEQLRSPAAVAEVLSGRRLPPPTLTAVGLRVYLDNDKPAAKKQARDDNSAFGNVRRVELLEKVLMHRWVEAGQGFVGPDGKASAAGEPAPAAVAVGGGLLPGVHAARGLAMELLQIETRGPFFYDAPKNLARFDVLPLADPNLPNDVQVWKVPPGTGTQRLFSQVLELEFSGPPTAGAAAPPRTAAPAPGGAGRVKRLHAWTYTPGRVLTVSSEKDELQAYGQDLVHDQTTDRTELTGAPLHAVQKRNVLNAGGPKEPAVLVMEPAPEGKPAAGAPPAGRRIQATVRGFGKVEMFDAAAGASTVTASWRTSMVQSKESVNDQELDLFTLTDDAKFEDVKADYWLKGNVLKLWLRPPPQPAGAPAEGAAPVAARGQPHRLQAIGNVTGHSADLDIEQSDQLNTMFSEGRPQAAVAVVPPVGPKAATAPKQPAAARPAGPVPPVAVGNPPEPKPAEKPKPPTKLRARTIDTWVVRRPAPAAPQAAGAPPNERTEGGMKYELEKALCDGMVSVHQDPADATKPQGTDIIGSRMIIEGSPDGNILTVFGWEDRPGELHNDGTHLIGPKVVVDQLHNVVTVEGRGSLAMPTSSDLSGAALRQAEVVVVHFKDGMKFEGTLKYADFFGKVNASQGGSWVACHTLRVNFDRPVYLSQTNTPGSPARPAPKGPNAPAEEKAKIDTVYCYPAPADSADTPRDKQVWYTQLDRDPDTGKVIRRQQLVAHELTLKAQVRDPAGGEPYKEVIADGPGEVRTWQVGAKDDLDPPAPRQPVAAKTPAAAESEMKLTEVKFTGRMTGQDKGKTFQSATFLESVQVIQVATDNPDLVLDRHRLPPRAVHLTCDDQLVVWTHRRGNEPAVQHMVASGNAYIQNETYDGSGETITLEGKLVTLRGAERLPARIKKRFGGDSQAGKLIVFDRATNYYEVKESIDGTLTPPAPAPKKK